MGFDGLVIATREIIYMVYLTPRFALASKLARSVLPWRWNISGGNNGKHYLGYQLPARTWTDDRS